jgi:phosphatidylinositol glycan class H protein
MLTVKRPSPTTVLYKVSTRSPTETFPVRLRRTLIGLVRILLGLSLLCLLITKSHDSLSPRWKARADRLSSFLPARLILIWTTSAARIPWTYLAPLSLVMFSLILRKAYTTESLLVIRGLGVQTTTSSPTYLSTATTRFIPTNMIQDIFIHEAFKGFEVRFYLSILVENEHDVVVVFPVSLFSCLFISFY